MKNKNFPNASIVAIIVKMVSLWRNENFESIQLKIVFDWQKDIDYSFFEKFTKAVIVLTDSYNKKLNLILCV